MALYYSFQSPKDQDFTRIAGKQKAHDAYGAPWAGPITIEWLFSGFNPPERNFFQKVVQYLIEFFRLFHHRGVTAFIDEKKPGIFDQFIEFFCDKWWGNGIL